MASKQRYPILSPVKVGGKIHKEGTVALTDDETADLAKLGAIGEAIMEAPAAPTKTTGRARSGRKSAGTKSTETKKAADNKAAASPASGNGSDDSKGSAAPAEGTEAGTSDPKTET